MSLTTRRRTFDAFVKSSFFGANMIPVQRRSTLNKTVITTKLTMQYKVDTP